MAEHAAVLKLAEHRAAEQTVQRHPLYALNCHSNHIQVVTTAHGVLIDDVMNQFKAWRTRHLKAHRPG
jgi:hypothetical protein